MLYFSAAQLNFSNFSTSYVQSFVLSHVSVSTLPSCVHSMTSVFVAFTFSIFLSNASCHSTTILSVLLSLSISPSHQHTVSPIFLLFRHSFITSSTTTNRKSLGALHTPGVNPLSLGNLLTHHILFSLWLLLRFFY